MYTFLQNCKNIYLNYIYIIFPVFKTQLIVRLDLQFIFKLFYFKIAYFFLYNALFCLSMEIPNGFKSD